MNKKLLNGFLAASLLMGGAMSVTSCKDEIEDVRAELKADNLSLQEKVKVLEEYKNQLELNKNKCKEYCDSVWNEYRTKGFTEDLNKYVEANGKHENLKWYLEQIDGALKGVKYDNLDGITGEYTSLAGRFGAIEAILDQLVSNSDVLGLEDLANKLEGLGTDLPAVIDKALDADRRSQQDSTILAALLEGYEYSGDDVTNIKGLLKTISGVADSADINAKEALKLANALKADYKNLSDSMKQAFDSIGNVAEALNVLEGRVAANEEALKRIDAKVYALTGQLNKLVTGIVLQQVSNPVFGKINLPADIKSGMLMAYYGEAINVNFPGFGSTANEYDHKPWLSADDQARLGIQPTKFDGILGLQGDKLDLGTIYMTVNPVNLDLEGTTFEFVNSKGETGKVQLSALAASDEELKFGFGRASENTPNSLYTADATVKVNTIADLEGVKFTVQEDFKSRVEELLRNHSLSDIASLTKLVFDQFNNKLTAYGVRASWKYDEIIDETDDLGQVVGFIKGEKENATYSEFSLAATTFKPLSYKFLYGKTFRPIGNISPIEDFNLTDEIDIKVPSFNFNFSDVQFNFTFGDITVSLAGEQIALDFPETKVYEVVNGVQTNKVIGTIPAQTIYAKDLTSLENALSKAISESLKTQDQKLQQAFKEAMTSVANKINAEINAEMKKFQTDINEQFKDIVGNIEDKVNGYLGTVNKYINKVNGLINRVNKLLKDPNHYLQVTMLYNAGDGQLHQLSNNPALPSWFKLDGGNGLRLFATSFNGEILVPSYQKYVAVTNVWRTGDQNKTTATDILNAANGVAQWNTVVAGTTTEYSFKLTKGYTYEIVYSSLDYHGVTSTRKFYLSAE